MQRESSFSSQLCLVCFTLLDVTLAFDVATSESGFVSVCVEDFNLFFKGLFLSSDKPLNVSDIL